ncbi:MAG: RNA methyltransferase, partial [Spirochaetales bacterium]|nr:RNA methyltransferase [Spirochaetales bacterium]
ILRSADQFSAALIIVPERRSASANETVIRISSGAAQYVTMSTVPNLARELDVLKEHGFWIYGADMNGDSSYNTRFSKRTAIVMGSEGSGMRSLVRTKCDHIVSIPMSGHIDSLNVSVAAGILMYEYRRSFPV